MSKYIYGCILRCQLSYVLNLLNRVVFSLNTITKATSDTMHRQTWTHSGVTILSKLLHMLHSLILFNLLLWIFYITGFENTSSKDVILSLEN